MGRVRVVTIERSEQADRVDPILRDRLLAMAARDLETRERLASDGSLFDGYHPEMQAVHEENARALQAVIVATGWPGSDVAGREGAEAAWLIAQHAIGLPDFMRMCLRHLERAVAAGTAPAWQMAMMIDRIRTYEGRPQMFGTSFDWDDGGQQSPRPIEDPEGVDRRRASVGLEPLAAAIDTFRARDFGQRPADLVAYRKGFADWLRKVGWR